jgi:pimeloyl-ACP methyl ester carboxylesterase
MWQHLLSYFVPHFKVITPDSRGHGRTDNPAGELSYRMMADDVAAFVQALGLTKPLVFGYSDGGQIALDIGIRHPGLTRALVVGAASCRTTEHSLAGVKALGFAGPGVVNFEQLLRESPMYADILRTEHFRADDPDYWQTLLRQLSAMVWTPLDYTAEDFQKVTEPALILLGDRDELNPLDQSVEMYQLIPNAELAILPNASHSTPIFSDRSKLAMDIVLDFLLRHSAQTQPQ